MRKLAIAMALASTALATPAVARDGSWYVGIEGGAMLVEDTELDVSGSYTYEGQSYDFDIGDAIVVDHETGVDLDIIAGYDFGMFRAEAEAGYKRASIDELSFAPLLLSPDTPVDDVDGSVRVWSAMVNGMLDFGDADDWSGFLGAGVGLASVRYKLGTGDIDDFDGDDISESDSGIAWQLIAGIRKAISYNLDLGVKYRYFTVPNVDFSDDFADIEGRFRSHSILASLVYNFGAPPAPPPVIVPPPPPPPPATQTCPDGSVILATDTCPPAPEPYVPPPPPPPAPERG